MGPSASRSASQHPQATGTPSPRPEPTVSSPPSSSATPIGYTFPQHKLKRRLTQANKTPLVLVACGSFSPVTVLHLQLFELAERHVERTHFEVVGNYVSPCSDNYGKSSLVPAHHRIKMCQLAIDERKSNVMIDEWEALRRDSSGRPLYTPTSEVLERLDHQINHVLGGIQAQDGSTVKAQVMLLMGADLAQTMADPKVWAPADLDIILGQYGGFVVERPDQCDIHRAIEPLKKYHGKIWVVPSFPNDVSSTKIRAQIRSGQRALDLPESVFEYIKAHHLYQDKLFNGGNSQGADERSDPTPRSPVAVHR